MPTGLHQCLSVADSLFSVFLFAFVFCSMFCFFSLRFELGVAFRVLCCSAFCFWCSSPFGVGLWAGWAALFGFAGVAVAWVLFPPCFPVSPFFTAQVQGGAVRWPIWIVLLTRPGQEECGVLAACRHVTHCLGIHHPISPTRNNNNNNNNYFFVVAQ